MHILYVYMYIYMYINKKYLFQKECATFQKERPLPSVDEMWADIRRKKDKMARQYVESQRHTIQVDYVTFMDELATLCGCSTEYGLSVSEFLFHYFSIHPYSHYLSLEEYIHRDYENRDPLE